MFNWANIQKAIWEWIQTFSNKPSFFASKRIERFAVFALMLLCSIYFLIKGIYNWELSATDLIIVVGGWLGYAGYNTYQLRKDKSKDEPQAGGGTEGE